MNEAAEIQIIPIRSAKKTLGALTHLFITTFVDNALTPGCHVMLIGIRKYLNKCTKFPNEEGSSND